MRWLLALLFATAACASRLPRPHYVAQPTSALAEVPEPPPPARVEEVPDRPAEDAVWLDGEWIWRGRRWSWNPGRWVRAPAGAVYSPWTSVRREDGVLFYAPGTWRDAAGEVVASPPALALGHPSSSVVFDAEGDVQKTGRTVDADRMRARDGGA